MYTKWITPCSQAAAVLLAPLVRPPPQPEPDPLSNSPGARQENCTKYCDESCVLGLVEITCKSLWAFELQVLHSHTRIHMHTQDTLLTSCKRLFSEICTFNKCSRLERGCNRMGRGEEQSRNSFNFKSSN